MTPDGLGRYLTALVSAKRERYDEDDSWLLLCGVAAVLSALKCTKPGGIGTMEEQAALAMFQARQWLRGRGLVSW